MSAEPGWLGAIPPLALALTILIVPGLLVAVGLKWPAVDALGAAPTLTLPILALAVVISTVTRWSWGWPLLLAVVLVSVTGLLAARRIVVGRGLASGTVASAHGGERASGRAGLGVTLAAAAGAGLIAAVGIGSPGALNQTYDGVFHVNVVRLLTTLRVIDPRVFAEVNDPGQPGGFYPPLFHSVATQVSLTTGVDAVVATNVVAVAMAACWPLTILLLVRWTVGHGVAAHVLGAAAALSVTLFPILLLTFGVLWPNTLSLLSAPVMTALGARALDVLPRGATELSRRGALATFLACVPGIVLAHPGGFFALVPLLGPAVVLAWSTVVSRARRTGTRALRRAWVGGAMVAAVMLALWVNMNRIPVLKVTREFYWTPRNSPAQALGEVLGLSTDLNPAQFVVGFLAVGGVVIAWRTARLLWLAASYVVLALLVILATAFDGPIRAQFTGFWYNDGYRVFAMLPTVVVPLSVIGGLALRERVTQWVSARSSREDGLGRRLRPLARHAELVSLALVVGLIVAWIPGRGGPPATVAAVRGSYNTDGRGDLVSAPEEAMYRRLRSWVPADGSIAGNPWEGSVYAGLLADRASVWAFFTGGGSDRDLLRARFRDYQSDPRVCAAVQRLKVFAVVSDTERLWDSTQTYPGFERLDTAPGLTVTDRGGTAQAYAVAPCRAGDAS